MLVAVLKGTVTSLKGASVQCSVSPKNVSCPTPFKHRLITSVSVTCHSRVIFGSQFGQEEGEEARRNFEGITGSELE